MQYKLIKNNFNGMFNNMQIIDCFESLMLLSGDNIYYNYIPADVLNFYTSYFSGIYDVSDTYNFIGNFYRYEKDVETIRVYVMIAMYFGNYAPLITG